MGYTSTGGPKGLGQFNNTPSTQADLNQLVDLIAERGNYLGAVTTSERDAVSGAALYTGLVVLNTTTSALEVYNGSGWALLAALPDDQPVALTNAGGTTFVNQTNVLTTYKRGGSVALNGRVRRSAGTGVIAGVIASGHRPPVDWRCIMPSQDLGNTLGPTFLVNIAASTGEITLTSLGGGSGTWDSDIWIVLDSTWPAS